MKILGDLLSLKGSYVTHVVSGDTRLLIVISIDGVLIGLREDMLLDSVSKKETLWTPKVKVKVRVKANPFRLLSEKALPVLRETRRVVNEYPVMMVPGRVIFWLLLKD